MQALFRYVDSDCSGYVSFDEFLGAVRGELNTRRAALVALAFAALDANGDGALTVDDVATRYDVSHHPDLVSGAASEKEVPPPFQHARLSTRLRGHLTSWPLMLHVGGLPSR